MAYLNRDRGSAHSGMRVWWWQSITGFYLVLLTVPLIIILKDLREEDYEMVLTYLSLPLGKALGLGFITSILTHAYLGVRIVIEDYVPYGTIRIPIIVFLNLSVGVIGFWAAIVILNLT